VCFVVWVPKLNGHEDNIDEATHAISDARVTHREEIGFSYFVFGRLRLRRTRAGRR
jgi:hypothetical protein